MYNRPSWADNLATHGVRCYPKQTVRSVQDGNAESDRFCALRWSVLGSVADYPLESQIMSLKNRIHAPLNAGNFTSESGMVLTEFVEKIYLSYIELYRAYIEELRESTKKGSCRAYLHA